MNVGYARVSRDDQVLRLQTDALRAAGCEKLFSDTASGANPDRPGLAAALSYVRTGDTLVVWRLDRLGRTLLHLIRTIHDLEERGVAFRSLTETLDTTTAQGRLMLHMFGMLAEFERELIRERTKAGLRAARVRGRLGGHPRHPALNTPAKREAARKLVASETYSIPEVCQVLKVSRATLYRCLASEA